MSRLLLVLLLRAFSGCTTLARTVDLRENPPPWDCGDPPAAAGGHDDGQSGGNADTGSDQ